MALKTSEKRARAGPGSAGKSARGKRTRERIRVAANQLFLKKGFEKTTVDAIATAAGVSKGTFYLHFERKEDLLLEYGARRLQLIREVLPDILTRKSFREAINEILDATIRGKPWSRRLTGLAILEMDTSYERFPVQAPHKLLEPLVELGQFRGEIRRDVPAGPLAQFMLRSILGALRDWGLGTDDLSREEALDYALTLVFDAMLTQNPGKD
ncbi:MAG: TetR/AcrR family transcriptional regulator [Deltaproteobacteria bacterium]|nr:TetR/AcrR family transcriptional regulator [Deltaproteobacteria bacterium]